MSNGKTNVAIVKVPSSGPAVTRVTKTSPQTSVMKVITGKGQSKRALTKGNKGPLEVRLRIGENMSLRQLYLAMRK